MQAELTQKGQQLGEQNESLAALTAQHTQLTATAQRDNSALQSLQDKCEVKAAHVHDLETQLAGQHRELQSSQTQLQQQKDAHGKLESQLELQAAQWSAVSQEATNLEVDKQQLQQKLDDMVCDQQQMQSRLADERAAADKQLSALNADLLQLQVTAYNTLNPITDAIVEASVGNIPCLVLCNVEPMLFPIPYETEK